MSTQTDDMADSILAFVRERFALARKRNVARTDDLLDSGIVDSMGILDLVTHLEQTYRVAISDEELMPENFRNVECIAQFVKSKSAVR